MFHYCCITVLVEFENLPKGWISKKPTCSWNRGKAGGWERNKDLPEAASEAIDNIIKNKELTNKKVFNKVEKIENKIKFQSLGKTKPPTRLRVLRRLEGRTIYAGRLESEDEKVNTIFKGQSKELEDEINNIKSGKPGKVTNVFKMAEIVGGAKKQQEETHGIVDPENNEVVVATEQIKRVSLAHCMKVLQNNPIEPEAELWVQLESDMHEAEMKEDTDQEANITKEDFNYVVRKLKAKKENLSLPNKCRT